MLQRSGCISRVAAVGSLLIFHLLLLAGPIVAFLYISGARGDKDAITPLVVGFNVFLSLVAAYILYGTCYGVRRKLVRAFRSSNLHDVKLSYKFDRQSIEVSSTSAQSRFAWSLVDRFVEFRDGFLVLTGPSGYWVPKRAFTEPFEEVELAELAKSLTKKYEFIDKLAGLSL
jgi:YcxB-like protein